MRRLWLCSVLAAGASVACSHAPVQTGASPSTVNTAPNTNALERIFGPSPEGAMPSQSPSPSPAYTLFSELPGWLPQNPPVSPTARQP